MREFGILLYVVIMLGITPVVFAQSSARHPHFEMHKEGAAAQYNYALRKIADTQAAQVRKEKAKEAQYNGMFEANKQLLMLTFRLPYDDFAEYKFIKALYEASDARIQRENFEEHSNVARVALLLEIAKMTENSCRELCQLRPFNRKHQAEYQKAKERVRKAEQELKQAKGELAVAQRRTREEYEKKKAYYQQMKAKYPAFAKKYASIEQKAQL